MAGELVASVVVDGLLSKLRSGLGSELGLLWNFNNDLEEMKSTLESIQAVLNDAEKRSFSDNSVRLWLKKLKAAAYDIEDMLLDKFQIQKHPKVQVLKSYNVKSCFSIPVMAHKFKGMKKNLDKIAKDRKNYSLREEAITDQQQVIEGRETDSSVKRDTVLGREKEVTEIIKRLLMSTTEDICIIPIVGIGGLGKTTLAKLIYNDDRIKEVFKPRIWVHAMDFNVAKLAEAIRSSAGTGNGNMLTLDSKTKGAQEVLDGKKFLIVLDDVWNEDGDKWEAFKRILQGGEKESKILVTTRSERVSSIMDATKTQHNLKPLSDDVCLKLFELRAFGSAGAKDIHLASIGEEIVKKCQGVPLTANALGGMLHFEKGEAAWKKVRDSDLWELKEDEGSRNQLEKKIMSSLKLSYQKMPSPLKQCFVYCSSFPRAFKLDRDVLIQQWIAQRFIQTKDEVEALQIGDGYVNYLLSISFLEEEKFTYSYWFEKEEKATYKMHDLVYDLARWVAGYEVSDALESGKYNAMECRYASVINYNEASKELGKALPRKVRALHFQDCTSSLPKGIFSYTKCLRVLDFRRCFPDELPTSIYKLKQLRYLRLRLPDDLKEVDERIGKLGTLERLIISGCRAIHILPTSIGKLYNLTYLEINDCHSLSKIPNSIESLQRLNSLKLAYCPDLTSLPESLGDLVNLVTLNIYRCSIITLPASIGKLYNLIYFEINDCVSLSKIPNSIGSLQRLNSLKLVGCLHLRSLPESLGDLVNLVTLDINNYSIILIPKSIGSLQKLNSLKLVYCFRLTRLPESLGDLVNLVTLDIKKCYIITLPASIGKLYNLIYLEINGCESLSKIPNSIGSLQRLNSLKLVGCRRLTSLPESLGDLVNLVTLDIKGCSIITLPASIGKLHKLIDLDLSFSGKLLELPHSIGELQKLNSLKLYYCYNLGSLPESLFNLMELRTLDVRGCAMLDLDELCKATCNMRHLKIQRDEPLELFEFDMSELELRLVDGDPEEGHVVRYVSDAKRINLKERGGSIKSLSYHCGGYNYRRAAEAMLEALQPHQNLQELQFSNYGGSMFPSWMRSQMESFLPNLVKITLRYITNCEHLPVLGQLPKLEEIIIVGTWKLRRLSEEDLCGARNTTADASFPSVKRLELRGMDELEEWVTAAMAGDDGERGASLFPCLEHLAIHDCPKLRRIHTSITTPLKRLLLQNMSELEEWVTAAMAGDDGERGASLFPCLEELTIHDCPKLRRIHPCIPPSVRRLSLSSIENNLLTFVDFSNRIKYLEIQDYGLDYFRPSIGRLTSLETLKLERCIRLATLPEWLGELFQLQHLEIYRCPCIYRLPQSIQGLTALKRLRITGCRESLLKRTRKETGEDWDKISHIGEIDIW